MPAGVSAENGIESVKDQMMSDNQFMHNAAVPAYTMVDFI